MTPQPRILVVDDHEIARKGLLLTVGAAIPGLLLGEASTAQEALERLQAAEWDLVVLDLNLPGRGGLDLLSELKRLWPARPVLVVSSYAEEEFALRCLRLGASGYVAKTSGTRDLVVAVRKVLAGGKYVTAALAERLADASMGLIDRDPGEALTVRELQVLRLVAAGRSIREIAAELQLGERTVSTYRARIGMKLRLTSNVELTRYAMQHGLAD